MLLLRLLCAAAFVLELTSHSSTASDSDLTSHPNARLLPLDKCGPYLRHKGGSVAELDEYPWLVQLWYIKKDGHQESLCEGALINKRYVLTAAHCIIEANKAGMKLVSVRIGEYNLETDLDCMQPFIGDRLCASPHVDVPVEEFIPHPDYVARSFNNTSNIGLLRLTEDVKWTDFVQPTCLPLVASQSKKVVPGSTLSVSGWGCKDSSVKMQHFFQLVEDEVCLRTFHRHFVNQLCADGKSAQGACAGKEGGPLVAISELGGHYGMTTFGVAATRLSHDSIRSYTKVETFMPWILNTLKP